MNFKLRVDGSWSDISGVIITKIEPYCEKVAFYQHPAEFPKGVHVHALLWGWTKKEDTLRNVIKALRPGNATTWSYELCQNQKKKGPPVNEDFISYMSKGKFDPCLLKGWSQEYILEQRAKGYDKKDVIPIVERGGTMSNQPDMSLLKVVKARKLTSEEKMTAWLVQNVGWKVNEHFGIPRLQAKSSVGKIAIQTICNDVIRPQVVAYACGRVHNQQLVAMVRNAMWIFSDDEVREVIKNEVGRELTFS